MMEAYVSQLIRQVVSAIQHLRRPHFEAPKGLKARVECRVEHRDVVDPVLFPPFPLCMHCCIIYYTILRLYILYL